MKRAKYFFALALASVTAFSGLLALAPQPVSAAVWSNDLGTFDTQPGNSVIAQAVIWSEYSAVAGGHCKFAPRVVAKDIIDGKWFVGNAVTVGHHTEPIDGKLGCDNEQGWFTNLLSAAGYSTPDSVTTIAKQVYTYVPAEDTYILTSQDEAKAQATMNATLVTILNKFLFSGHVPSPPAPPAEAPDYITYEILFQNFIAGHACNAVETPTAGGLQGYTKNVNIQVYDETTGSLVPKNYSYKTPGWIGIGYGLPNSVGGASDGHLNCQTIADALKNRAWADDLAKYLQWHPDAVIGSSAGDTAGAELECGTLKNPLNWVICPMVQGINALTATLDNAINGVLTLDTQAIFNDKTGTGALYHKAWASFRGFALAILVIAALVMVIAQALGMEIFDAYTIKKILPRLIIAIIGISLSWSLLLFLVTLTNELGNGIRSLIYYPFHGFGGGKIPLGGGSTVALAFVSGAGILALGPMGLLSFVATAALAVIVAFLVLVMRQILLIILILLAPIAIACYILPNTHGAWKLWSESLVKGLMMFPIIVAFLAGGRVLAVTTASAANPSTLYQLIGFAAYFLPYFLIPMTFSMAGGLMRFVGGTINDRNRGAFDRLKKYRQTKTASNMHRAATGDRFNNNSLNAITSHASTRGLGITRRGRAAYRQKIDIAQAEQGKGKAMGIQHADDALRAATYDTAWAARKNMQKDFADANYTDEEVKTAVAEVQASGGFGRSKQIWAAEQLSAIQTGYSSGGIDQVAKTIARVSHGNESMIASVAGNINSGTKASRPDLAPGFAALNKLARQEAGVEGGKLDYAAAAESAWDSVGLYQHANSKPQNINAAIAHFTPLLTSSDANKRQQAAVFYSEMKVMQPNSNGEVKNSIQAALEQSRTKLDALYDKGNTATVQFLLPDSPAGVTMTDNKGNKVTETGRARVERLTRSYERPDPNVLNTP